MYFKKTNKLNMKRIILILNIFVLLACGNNSNNTDKHGENIEHIIETVTNSGFMKQIPSKPIEINAENTINIEYDTDFADKIIDIKYIYLKTEEPIGYITKAMIHKNKIYVVDWMISNKVFIFDMEGNLIKIISDSGGGPKEYIGLGYVDIGNDEIIVSDRLNFKRLYYTLEGEYIRHERCLPSVSFAVLKEKFILMLGYPQSFTEKVTPTLVVSVKDSALRKAFPYQNIQKQTTSGEFNYNYKGDLLFTPVVSDTVYQILTDSTFTAKYFVKHKKSVWQLYDEELTYDEISRRILDGYSQLASQFFETEKNAEFMIYVQDVNSDYVISHSHWYDKETKKTYTCINCKNRELNVIRHIINGAIGVWKNYYIGEIRPEQIEDLRKYYQQMRGTKDSLRFKNEELRKIIEMKDDPNQVLVLYKLDFNK
jgi:hypothetical protein